jgi:hypothetical protein
MVEDEHHITHIHQIVPKPSLTRTVGSILSKKSRSRSGSVLSTTGDLGMVIGVSVLEATVESRESEQADRENSGGGHGVAVVVAGAGSVTEETEDEGRRSSTDSGAERRRVKRKSSRMSVLQDKIKALRDRLRLS